MDPFIHYGIGAGTDALTDSGLVVTEENAERIGVIVGSGIGGVGSIEKNRNLSIMHGLKGHNMSPVSACATATHSIGDAARMISYGDADIMLGGGAEMCSTPLGIGGFAAMRALSTRNDDPTAASRPWDKDRDGFVLGDGAGVLILEEYESAKARGAEIYCELAGFGMSNAGLNAEDIDYINAHGTSTPAGDVAETNGIKLALGDHANKVAVSSTKSMTGHLLGAAGGIEAVFSVLAIRDQILPPTINIENQDPDCDLDYVANTARDAKIDVAMMFLPLALLIAGAASFYGYSQFNTFKASKIVEDVASFEIKKGSNIKTVAKDLEQSNILKPAILIRILSRLNKQDSKIKAGEYRLEKDMTPDDVLTLFTKGKTIQYQTRIPEGTKFTEIVKLIKSDKNLKQTLSDDDYKNIMSKLKTKYQHHKPEGWFFPDTFSYPKNTTDLQFLQRSHDAMLKLLNAEWEKRKPFKGINTPYDALILASIIEKETGAPDDRGKVARVFINRLNIDMLLQTDPTVIYGMGDTYKGNIRKKDLKKDTPYNTYTRKGLTPTPIATPSAASIKAAFNPSDGDMLYFVAKGDEPGGTDLGEAIRELLISKEFPEMHHNTELLLMFAARAEHLEKKIIPALEQDADIGLARAKSRGETDRFEQQHIDFFNRVRSQYLKMAEENQSRYRIVQAQYDLKAVQQQIDETKEHLPHALLLVGEEGIGKRILAERMARSLLCMNPVNFEACGNCQSCKTHESGANPDYTKVELLEDKQQITIINPIERMNNNAANSLLKSLEEPANNSVIILVASHLGKILPTIKSRCQLVSVQSPSYEESFNWLKTHHNNLENLETRLNIAASKPLKALEINDDDIESRFSFLEDLIAVVEANQSLVTTAKKYEKANIESLLNWQITWAQQLIKQTEGNEPKSRNQTRRLNRINSINYKQQLFKRVKQSGHWTLYQQLIKQKQYIHTSVNPLMFVENMLLLWLEAGK
ncbi:3-oxoacyl-[acyl-carrier-protein] synthase 2 [Nymphon striatum]|nr:3-oxoacyl-[acyl-carrier-protein] synthase 2 [Nymphon striatum]